MLYFIGPDSLSVVDSYHSKNDLDDSADTLETSGACSELERGYFRTRSQNLKEERSQEQEEKDYVLKQFFPGGKSQNVDCKPLVFSGELFAEDADLDNESEWSIDIK